MNSYNPPDKLIDCGSSAPPQGFLRELFLVEGDSASQAVARVRDPRFQAVLPMQGKPMNAVKASQRAVRQHLWFSALVDAMGIGWEERPIDQLRYDRIVLLFDPDADGIHCGALMVLFFERCFPSVLLSNRLVQIQPPQFELRAHGYRDSVPVYGERHLRELRAAMDQKQIPFTYHRYRGLASLNDRVLHQTCVAPCSRTAYLLRKSDAEMAHRYFGRPGSAVR